MSCFSAGSQLGSGGAWMHCFSGRLPASMGATMTFGRVWGCLDELFFGWFPASMGATMMSSGWFW